MKSIHHEYENKQFMRTFTRIFNIIGILLPVVIIVLGVVTPLSYQQPITFADILTLIFMGVFSGAIVIMVGNYSVEITSDSEGLHIDFMWKHLLIPWNSIVDIRPVFNISYIKNIWVIRTRALTPFHRIYGLFYSFSLAPCIVYNTNISDSGELSKRIKASVERNKKKR